MVNTLTLHHCAKRITPGSLEFIMDLFKKLGCQESYWDSGARWAMVEQKANNAIIQFLETDQAAQDIEEKRNSHIAFLSDDPQKDIARIEKWVHGQDMEISVGRWSDKELYFDCPGVFIDFVIEVMHKSIIEQK